MTHPGEKLNQVSSWISSDGYTLGEIVVGLNGTIGFMCTRSVAVKDRLHRRCCTATKMLIPLLRVNKPVIGQDDGFRHLGFVEHSCCAFIQSLIGGLAHPAPSKGFLGKVVYQPGKVEILLVIATSESEQKAVT